MRLSRLRQQRRRGFTLLEVLLVVAILVALAAMAIPQLVGVQAGAQIDNAKVQVAAIENAVQYYRTHTGEFPSTQQGLTALITPPNPTPDNWRGPYLKATADLKDPWGNQYNYEFPGKHSSTPEREMPDVWSNGPDRTSGTQDDIGNWGAVTTR